MIQFAVGARVQRIGKGWGNIASGSCGIVKEVLDFGKKLRVRFDDYTSDREDGTVIVMTKSMGFAPPQTLGKVLHHVIVEDRDAPIRSDPFRGVRTHRVSATETVSAKKPKQVLMIEHVDLTVPFHEQAPPRHPDWLEMSDYSDSCEIEGLVGEGYDEEDQEQVAEDIDHRLAAAQREPKIERSLRSSIRPMLPFTAWEHEMRKRRFAYGELTKVETARGFTGCYRSRGDTLQNALNATLKVDPLPNK